MLERPGQKKLPSRQVLIVVAVLVIAAIIYVSGAWRIPFEVSTSKIDLLVIGNASPAMQTILNQDMSLVDYTVKSASQLELSPEQQFEGYDVILLDQHLGATHFDHSISRQLGEALENYVRTGGKLVVVMDSGIYRSGPDGTISSDISGWKANLGDIIPVECVKDVTEIGTCEKPITLNARIKRLDLSHKIMAGIEAAPLNPELPPYSLTTFDVKDVGDVIAIIDDEASTKTFPAIVEKKKLLGKTVYFNYDPASTPGIWQNTLEYLR